MTESRPSRWPTSRPPASCSTGVAIRTPMEESRWLSALAGGPVHAQVREPPAHRVVQDPRRLRPDLPALARRSAPAAWSRPRPATTPRASRWPPSCSASRPPCSCPRARRSPRRRRPGATAPTWSSHGRYLEDALAAAREFADETGAVLIHPFDHVDIVAGQGTAGLEILEQAPDVADRAGADRRRRAARRDRDRGQGAAPRRPGRRRAGRGRRGVSRPRCAQGRPVAAGVDDDDGRRHRGRAAGRRHRSPRSSDYVDEIVTVSEESLSRALLALLERAKMVVEPAGAAAVAAILDDPHGVRDARRWRCSPAATSTRCCSAR